MVRQTAPSERTKVALPPRLHWTVAFGLRYPVTSALLCVIEGVGAFLVVFYTRVVSAAITTSAIVLCDSCCLLAFITGLSISSSGILDDLVDFLGESGSKECFTWANIEAVVCVFPCLVTGAIPTVAYFLEIREETLTEVEWVVVYTAMAVTTVLGPFLSLGVVTGSVELMRLVAALLKCCVQRHFGHLDATMACEGLSAEERREKLNRHYKRMKAMFEKANKCITAPTFACVVIAYLVSLVMVLQVVVSVRDKNVSPFMVMCFVFVSVLFTFFATLMLYSMTTVADLYEDLAANLSFDIELRFRITDTFPGPAGVKLLSSIEDEYLHELSFNFHHKPLDARTLETTFGGLAAGTVVAVVLGIIT